MTTIPGSRARTVRLTAVLTLLALSFPAFPTDRADAAGGAESPRAVAAEIKHDARNFGQTVRYHSTRLAHEVAHGAHQFKVRVNEDMHRIGQAFHHWWEGSKG